MRDTNILLGLVTMNFKLCFCKVIMMVSHLSNAINVYLIAFILNPAPEGLTHELEFFGRYYKSDPAVLYKFHFWFDKNDPNKDYWEGTINLPFNCTTENHLFCLYKSESKTKEGGKLFDNFI